MKRHYRNVCFLIVAFVIVGGIYYGYHYKKNLQKTGDIKTSMPYITNIVRATEENTYFRNVLFTGARSQLVIMAIPPGGEVGEETHPFTEQTLFFLSGSGKALLDGTEHPIVAGDVVVVPPGTKHNFINTGTDFLKIYTVYAPPNHIDGRVHITKADADNDVADEAYGQEVK